MDFVSLFWLLSCSIFCREEWSHYKVVWHPVCVTPCGCVTPCLCDNMIPKAFDIVSIIYVLWVSCLSNVLSIRYSAHCFFVGQVFSQRFAVYIFYQNFQAQELSPTAINSTNRSHQPTNQAQEFLRNLKGYVILLMRCFLGGEEMIFKEVKRPTYPPFYWATQ